MNLQNQNIVNYILKFINVVVICLLIKIHKREKQEEAKRIQKEEEEDEKDKKDWDVWTKETRYKEKDVNKWYIILGSEVARYKGEWADGVANGKGVKEFLGSTGNSHSIIEGNFVNGSANGYGTQTFDITADHERFEPYYEGEFKNGKQHGKGTYHYGNGCYRKGNLVKGKFEGNGIYYDSYKKRTWVGTYVDDVRDLDNGVWHDGEIKMEEVEDADEERKKILSKAEGESAPVEQFRVALNGLRQEWHAKWQSDKAVKGEI